MKALIAIVLIVVALLGIRELYRYWEEMKVKHDVVEPGQGAGAQPAVDPSALTGLPPALEASFETAKKQGAASLKIWLKQYRSYVRDPKLAAIELDYVVLAGAKNFTESREIFAAVKARTPTNSPVYPRIRQLEKTYQ